MVARGRSHYVILNKYPYSNGHVMVVPRTHGDRLDALSPAAFASIHELLHETVVALRDGEERAFIEMADRQVEFNLFAVAANYIRHTHPGLAVLEQPQFPDFGRAQGEKVRTTGSGMPV